MPSKDTERQETVNTTRDREPNRRNTTQQQGGSSRTRQQQQQPGTPAPGGGEPDVQENQRDRESSAGVPRQSQDDVERGGSGGDLPM
jgi:hypothetical protein